MMDSCKPEPAWPQTSAGDYEVAEAPTKARARVKKNGVAVAGLRSSSQADRGIAEAGDGGVAITGNGGCSKVTKYGVAASGAGGSASGGPAGCAVVGEGGSATAGDGGVAFARGHTEGAVWVGKSGVAVCWALNGKAKADSYGILVFRYQEKGVARFVIGHIEPTGPLKKNKYYKLDKNLIVEA